MFQEHKHPPEGERVLDGQALHHHAQLGHIAWKLHRCPRAGVPRHVSAGGGGAGTVPGSADDSDFAGHFYERTARTLQRRGHALVPSFSGLNKVSAVNHG